MKSESMNEDCKSVIKNTLVDAPVFHWTQAALALYIW